jgi:hypothetical protein
LSARESAIGILPGDAQYLGSCQQCAALDHVAVGIQEVTQARHLLVGGKAALEGATEYGGQAQRQVEHPRP